MEDRRKRKKGNDVNWLWLLVALFTGVAGTAVYFALSNRTRPAPIIIVPPEPTATAAPSPTPAPLTVFVNGAVVAPGVVEIPANGRLQDAIQAAMGFTDEANTAIVNLAQPLQDGVQIYVPTLDEEVETAVSPSRAIVIDVAPAQNGSGLININTATATDLETLPGIGPSTAAKIITHRQENGDFGSIEAIMDVTGIGEAKFNAISALITVEN
jgi:competence protein ComEA